jgi:hypothetical protein
VTSLTRARRFPLRLQLLFRSRAAEPWRRARTVAISRDGVCFVARNKMPVGTPLDMRFVVGREPAAAEVACRGRVIRRKASAAKTGTPTYGATIDWYRLKPMALSGLS